MQWEKCCVWVFGPKLVPNITPDMRSMKRKQGKPMPSLKYRFKLETKEALTEIQELLHWEGRRGELGEVIDVFGHVGQRRRLHQGADELHFTCHLLKNQTSGIIQKRSAKVGRLGICSSICSCSKFAGLRRRRYLSFPQPMGGRGGRGNQPGFHEILGLVQTEDSKQLAHARVRVTGLRHLLNYVSSFQVNSRTQRLLHLHRTLTLLSNQ